MQAGTDARRPRSVVKSQPCRFRLVPPLAAFGFGSGSPGRFHSPTHLSLPVRTMSLNGNAKPGSCGGGRGGGVREGQSESEFAARPCMATRCAWCRVVLVRRWSVDALGSEGRACTHCPVVITLVAAIFGSFVDDCRFVVFFEVPLFIIVEARFFEGRLTTSSTCPNLAAGVLTRSSVTVRHGACSVSETSVRGRGGKGGRGGE